MAILNVQNIGISFGGLEAVRDVSFSLEDGQIAGLVGPNGAGKTTLFNIISGLLRPNRGSITFRGTRIDRLAPHRIARLGIGRTFQDPRVFYEMDVLDHVLSGYRLRAENPLWALLRDRRSRHEWAEAEDKARILLERFGLGRRLHDKAQDLSFGEQRFLSIARMFAGEPRLVMLDEPTVGLDADGVGRLIRLLGETSNQAGLPILLVEHNMDVVLGASDRVLLMLEGRIAAAGTAAEMRNNPRMIEAYLGARYAARVA